MDENQDNKSKDPIKNDEIIDSELNKKPKKFDQKKNEELKAIGKSNCGKWIKFQQKLGEGAYKTVFKGYNTEEGTNVAWCEFKPHHVNTNEKLVQMIKEIEIMVRMNHKNIVSCYDVFDKYTDVTNPNVHVNVKSIILIQELMAEGTLKSVIKKNFINGELILKFSLIKRWLHQIVDALSYMHERMNPPIIHRDLKADNCFLDSNSSESYLQVKVGDFGLAKQMDKTSKHTMLGTLGFMAPEVFDEKYNAKVDIYAFGMMMLEVITNRTPYDECETLMQVAKKTMSGKWPDIFSLVTHHWTREVIACCIHPLEQYRPNSLELYYHPFFLNDEDDELSISPLAILPYFNDEHANNREASINEFVANMVLDSSKSQNQTDMVFQTKFNLRMEFRDIRFQSSFELDEGERLEFDLDIYNPNDVPELIYNLKTEFRSNIIEGLKTQYKNQDAKIVNGQVEKIFKSIEFQISFLQKMVVGKRWYYLLNQILSDQTESDPEDGSTGFRALAIYKKNWDDTTKRLEQEREQYIVWRKHIEETEDAAKKFCKVNRISAHNNDDEEYQEDKQETNYDRISGIDSRSDIRGFLLPGSDGQTYDILADAIQRQSQLQPNQFVSKTDINTGPLPPPTPPALPSNQKLSPRLQQQHSNPPQTQQSQNSVTGGATQAPTQLQMSQQQIPFFYPPYPHFPSSLSHPTHPFNRNSFLPQNYYSQPFSYPYFWPQSMMPPQYPPFPMVTSPNQLPQFPGPQQQQPQSPWQFPGFPNQPTPFSPPPIMQYTTTAAVQLPANTAASPNFPPAAAPRNISQNSPLNSGLGIGINRTVSVSTVPVPSPSNRQTTTKQPPDPSSQATKSKPREKSGTADDLEKILTLQEVMEYVSSKSHKKSSHPFYVIPVRDQSNAFRIMKASRKENSITTQSNYRNVPVGKEGKKSKKPSIEKVATTPMTTVPMQPMPYPGQQLPSYFPFSSYYSPASTMNQVPSFMFNPTQNQQLQHANTLSVNTLFPYNTLTTWPQALQPLPVEVGSSSVKPLSKSKGNAITVRSNSSQSSSDEKKLLQDPNIWRSSDSSMISISNDNPSNLVSSKTKPSIYGGEVTPQRHGSKFTVKNIELSPSINRDKQQSNVAKQRFNKLETLRSSSKEILSNRENPITDSSCLETVNSCHKMHSKLLEDSTSSNDTDK